MATIAKIQRAKGITYRAIIKQRGVVLKTKCFKTKTAARQWAKRIESDAETMEALDERGARLKLADLADEYLANWTGRAHSRVYQVRWWVSQLGNSNLSDIQAQDVRNALKAYKGGKTKHWAGTDRLGEARFMEGTKARSPATANRMKAALSAMFTYANQQGYTTRNPAKQVAIAPERNRRLRYLSDCERERLLHACRDSEWPKLYLLVLLALMTGARKGELKSLRWEQIDFQRRTVELACTKNNEPRVLTLPLPTIEELLKFREGEGLIFASRIKPDRPYDERKVWMQAREKAQIEDFRFHDLRHSAGSYLAMGGATLLEIADILGHENVQTTKRYAHLSTAHKQAVSDTILGTLSL